MDGFLKYEEASIQSSDQKDCSAVGKNRNRSQNVETDVGKELDELFPRQTKQGGEFTQMLRVSRKPATPFEINELRGELDSRLGELEMEEVGFSVKVRAVYDRLFDELIRQEIVSCPERGLLLARIGDERTETLGSMQKLCRSCFSLAITKNVLSRKATLQKRKEIPAFVDQISRAEHTLGDMREEWRERMLAAEQEESIRVVERTFLENQLTLANQQMTSHIEEAIDTEHRWLNDDVQSN